MNLRETYAYMKENGFHVHREGHGKTLWTDGITMIVTKSRGVMDSRAERNIQSAVRRAIEARRKPKPEPIVQKPAEPNPNRRIVTPTLTAPLHMIARNPDTVPPPPKENPPVLQKPTTKVIGSKKQYDPTDLQLINIRLKELFDQRYTLEEITQTINKEGFLNAQGQKFSVSAILYIMHKAGLRRHKTKAERQALLKQAKAVIANGMKLPQPPTNPFLAGAGTMSAPITASAPKFELAAPQPQPTPTPAVQYAEPPSMQAVRDILRDDKITAEKRIKIALAYLE